MSFDTLLHYKSFLTTPKAIQRALIIPSRINHKKFNRETYHVNYNDTFFMWMPPANRVDNFPDNDTHRRYVTIRDFFLLTKHKQREVIHENLLRTPESYEPHEGQYVIRPHRHWGGSGWQIDTDEDPVLWSSDTHYRSPLFPKRWEYRIIYFRGQQICVLLKRTEQNIPINEPWNHNNGSSFVTVHNYANNRLRDTRYYTDTEDNFLIKHSEFIGVDVMIDKDYNYAVCEINQSPAFTIESNLNHLASLYT